MELMILLAFVAILTNEASGACNGKRIGKFDNIISTDFLLKTFPTKSKLDCARECLQHNLCGTYFFVPKTFKCQLHRCFLDLNDNEPNNEEGARYYSLCSPQPCPVGYTYDPVISSMYRIYTVSAGGAAAGKSICHNEGGHLLFVPDIRTHNWIKEKIIAKPEFSDVDYFFIDGSDEATEGVWVDSQNAHLTWQKWAAPQPNSNPLYGAQNCLAMDRHHNFNWNDIWCKKQFVSKFGFICQIE